MASTDRRRRQAGGERVTVRSELVPGLLEAGILRRGASRSGSSETVNPQRARSETVVEVVGPSSATRSDRSKRRLPELIESMMPSEVPTAPMVLQARRNSAARVELMNEFGLLTSSDVAELNRSKAGNRAALASRWKREGKIFGVKHDGKDWFPGFQFETAGRPREIVGRVLDALGGARGWETALWFTGASGYLDGRRPVDVLDDDPEAVVEAARREVDEVYF